MKNIVVMVLCFVVSSCTVLFAQNTVIKGEILDENKQTPIADATIQIKNTNSYTVSDIEGKFSIKANIGDVLVISHINYSTLVVEISEEYMTIQMRENPIDLDNITVKADPLKDISQSVAIVDEIKATTQPRNVGDLFRDISGFGIQKRGAYASEPFFRAFKYEQLNVQYDGGMKVLNACPNRMDPITTHVIPDEIERIEIVKGPFTMRFGQNFGGIINLVSKNTYKYEEGFSGSIETGYELNGNNLSTSGNIIYKAKKFDVNVNGEYRNYGDYEDGNGTEVPSSFKTTDYSIKLGFEPTEKQRFQISWRQSFGRDIDHAGLMMDSPYDDSYLAGLDYKIVGISDKLSSFSIKGFYSYVDHLMTNENRPSFMRTEASSNVFATTYGGKTELTITPSESIFLFVGADANFIGREGNRVSTVKIMNGMTLPEPKIVTDKIWQDAKLNDVGVFVEGNFKFADNYVFTAGVRSDFVSSSIDDPENDFLQLYGGSVDDASETNISGTLSLKYKRPDFQWQLALGRGTRTASMIERYIYHFSVGVDPYEYVGNPYLDPEINNQIEVSFKKEYKQIEVGASVFYSLIQDYIVPVVDENLPRKFMPTVPPIYAKRFINIDEAVQAGFEWYWNYRFTDSFKLTTDISYTYAQNKELNEPLPQVVPLTAHAALHYHKQKYWFNLNSRFVGAQRRVSPSFMEPETGSFATFDFSVGFKPFKNLSIGASVLNIFDEAYYEHLNFSYTNSDTLSGRIYEPGRNITFRVNYSF